MRLQDEIRRRSAKVIGPVLGMLALAYFCFHGVTGEHGLLAWKRLDLEMASAQQRLAVVAEEHRVMEHRVALLSSAALDPDMLEERARIMLNVAHPDDVVILLKD